MFGYSILFERCPGCSATTELHAHDGDDIFMWDALVASVKEYEDKKLMQDKPLPIGRAYPAQNNKAVHYDFSELFGKDFNDIFDKLFTPPKTPPKPKETVKKVEPLREEVKRSTIVTPPPTQGPKNNLKITFYPTEEELGLVLEMVRRTITDGSTTWVKQTAQDVFDKLLSAYEARNK